MSQDVPFSILGIDPGKTGALSFVDAIEHTIAIYDMPIIQVGNGKRSEVCGETVADLILRHNATFGYIEDVWSLPQDGHVGAFNFGDKLGVVKGVMMALGVKFERVRPQVWKRNMRAPANKTGARQRAQELLPAAASLFQRVKDDGRAEASLIALYGAFDLDHHLKQPLTLYQERTHAGDAAL